MRRRSPSGFASAVTSLSPAGLAGFVEAAAGRRLALVSTLPSGHAGTSSICPTRSLGHRLRDARGRVPRHRTVAACAPRSRSRSRSSRWCWPEQSRPCACSRSQHRAARDPRCATARRPSITSARRPPRSRTLTTFGRARRTSRSFSSAAACLVPRRRGGGREPHHSQSASDRRAPSPPVCPLRRFRVRRVDPGASHRGASGYAIAGAYSGRTLADVGAGRRGPTAAGLIHVAEYLALSRLLFAFTGVPIRRLVSWIAVRFILSLDALSLIDPEWFDEHVLGLADRALPLTADRVRGLSALPAAAVDIALAAIAFGLMAWGLWRGIPRRSPPSDA